MKAIITRSPHYIPTFSPCTPSCPSSKPARTPLIRTQTFRDRTEIKGLTGIQTHALTGNRRKPFRFTPNQSKISGRETGYNKLSLPKSKHYTIYAKDFICGIARKRRKTIV
ncbi:hypothetical protein [Oscillatoria acuminata]|uniref:hypothetical protein n=1 Tax=Oscillatoria acuminata TaxID=118323 RepID=UPI0003079452|nr:hypothetical protein [Oscillatoria acuminata]